MSKNKSDVPFIGPLKRMTKNQSEHHTNFYRGRQIDFFLTDYVNVLTLSGVSSASWSILTLSPYIVTGGTGDISDQTVAVLLRLKCADSGSSGSNPNSLQVRPSGSTISEPTINARGTHINNNAGISQGWVPLTEDTYRLEYQRVATGSGTLTASIDIVGYKVEIQ